MSQSGASASATRRGLIHPVLRIGRALDGMPLVFELAAAARVRALPAANCSAAGRPLPAARRLVSGYAGWLGSLGGEDAPQRLARSLKASGFRPTRTPQQRTSRCAGSSVTSQVAVTTTGGWSATPSILGQLSGDSWDIVPFIWAVDGQPTTTCACRAEIIDWARAQLHTLPFHDQMTDPIDHEHVGEKGTVLKQRCR
jgi:hypothetical protein